MKRKKLFVNLLWLLLVGVWAGQAMAYDPDWQANQKKMFEAMQLKPGDVIDQSNADKIKDFVPDKTYNWVKKGDFILKIGEFKYDFSGEEAWDKATAANKGKYSLGSNKEVVEVSTGKFPMWLYGRPFPDVDFQNDPDAGIKFMHNKKVEECRTPTIDLLSETIWVGEKGYERDFQLRWRRYYFWSRPGGEVKNPTKTKSFELTQLLNPYDLTGTVILTDSPLDGSGDRQYVYVPAIRRVKKQSGASRSDPSFGSDFVSDDASGWGGQAETMSWKIVESERLALVPMESWHSERPDILDKQPDGSFKSRRDVPEPKFGWNDPDAPKGIAPWCPTSTVWVPRKVVVIEATPLDPYYNYGKQTYWIDKLNNSCCYYKITDDKAGEYWKAMIVIVACQQWGEGYKSFSSMLWHYVLDEKTHHASISRSRGPMLHGLYSDLEVLGRGVKLEMMRPDYIPTMTK